MRGFTAHPREGVAGTVRAIRQLQVSLNDIALAGLKLMLPFFAYGNNVAAKLMTDDDRVGGHIVRHLFVVLALVSLFPGRKAQAVGYD